MSSAFIDSTDWLEYAACRTADPAIFAKRSGPVGVSAPRGHWDRAKEYCSNCPVLSQCLNDVLSLTPLYDDEPVSFEMYQANMTPEQLTTLYRKVHA